MDTAWKFFSSPYNLSRITPKTLNFVVLSNPDVNEIYEGMEINYTVSPFLGIPLKWKTRIVKVDQGQSFIDFQEKGPFKYWSHLHDFVPNEWGVLMKDTVNYELYGGLLGGAAHKLIVGKKLEQIFDYRYKVLEELFPINEN